jgi:hypothetical protein
MRMAGSDDFQNKLNRSSEPVGGDFTYESEGGTGANGSIDQDMRISTPSNDGTWDRQVAREQKLPTQLGEKFGYGSDGSSSSGGRYSADVQYSSGSGSSGGGFDAGSVANKYIRNAARTNPINIEALDKSIRSRPLYHEAKGKLEDLNTFGDMYRYGREELPEWKQPTPMKGVEEPDFDGMYKGIRDDLDKYEV